MEFVSKQVAGEGKDSEMVVMWERSPCKWFVHNFLGISQIAQISHRRDDLFVALLFSEA
jgi:hypothetical protein